MRPIALDEFPLHQAPGSVRLPATTDRNFYDRCYFNAHDRTGDVFLVTGLGVYPNLGVIDAYAAVKRGEELAVVRFSDALGDDRLDQRVGAYRIEVVEPLSRIRLVCSGPHVSFDLTWQGSFPAVEEARHVIRHGNRTILDATRFAQVGTWSGSLQVGGAEITVDPSTWVGTRDRSWGIRPVGEAESAGRSAAEPLDGFWWLYVPLRFPEFSVIVIVQEQPDGYRSLNDAIRVWPDGRIEQLGWPRFEIRYRAGTRHPEQATIHLTDPSGAPVTISIDTLAALPLHVGCGYGGDPEWSHGRWMGRDWSSSGTYTLTDPAIAGRIPYGVIDHVARATCDGVEGWGLFEHATMGRHDPSGFADWGSTAT